MFAYEAGPTGYGLYDQINKAGYSCLVVPAAGTPKAPSDRVKTNRIDSRKLAESLRAGQLHGIHVPSTPYRYLRYLVQLRETLICQVVAYKNRIKGLLLMEGIPFPPATRTCQWPARVVEQLKTMDSPPAVRIKLDHLITQMEFTRKQLTEVTRLIQQFCIQDPELFSSINLLMTLPGIAWIVAMPQHKPY